MQSKTEGNIMLVDKKLLKKSIDDATTSELFLLTIDPLRKDSTKTAVAALTKFLSRTDTSYTVVAVRK